MDDIVISDVSLADPLPRPASPVPKPDAPPLSRAECLAFIEAHLRRELKADGYTHFSPLKGMHHPGWFSNMPKKYEFQLVGGASRKIVKDRVQELEWMAAHDGAAMTSPLTQPGTRAHIHRFASSPEAYVEDIRVKQPHVYTAVRASISGWKKLLPGRRPNILPVITYYEAPDARREATPGRVDEMRQAGQTGRTR